MAPELFLKRTYDESVDIFAYGTLLWEILTREVPFDGLDVPDIRSKVEKEEPLKIPYGTDSRIASIIQECRSVTPSSRPSFERIVEVFKNIV